MRLARPLTKPALAVSCLVLFAACLDESSGPEATDRAAAADLFAPWPGDESFRLASEPSVVVGLDESLPLDGSIGAVFFGDGIAIANRLSREVLILDAAGELRSRHGRRGEGPGDYINLSGIARHADGLITWGLEPVQIDPARRLRGVRRRYEGQPERDVGVKLTHRHDGWSLRKQRAARNLGDGIPWAQSRPSDGDSAAGGI